jgi:hypothetical protein
VHAPSVDNVWHQVLSVQPAPPRLLVLGTGLAALVMVGSRQIWPISRTAVTIAHEGGHALVAVATGRRLDGVRVMRSTAGVTISKGSPSGPGIVATAAAGYISPPLLGLGTAALLAVGHIAAALLLSLLLLAGLVIALRNAYGMLAVVIIGAAVAFVLWRGSATVEAVLGYAMAWFLLIGGVRPVLELQRSRHRGGARGSDADQLARLTGMPAGMWVFLFGLVALGSLALSAFWLTR